MRVVAVVAVLFLITWFAVGQAPAPAAGATKIGVVGTEQVMAQTIEGKAAQAEMEKKFVPRQKDLQARAAEIEKLQTELQQKGSSMTPAEQQRRSLEIQQKQKEIERLNEDFQADVNNAQQEIIGRLAKRVDQVVTKYGNDNKYHLILDSGQSGALFVATGADLTKEIIAAYDKQFPGTPATAKPPAAK